LIQTFAYPRAALIGNPSDGYYGKTIAFVFSNFKATVELVPSRQLQIIPGERDTLTFNSVDSFADQIRMNGYYGGIRIMKAAIKKFHDHCDAKNIKLSENFTISYKSDIPEGWGWRGRALSLPPPLKR
jgi:glucuronokinase